MEHNRKRILVTGGAGYIGSHTCKTLFQNGFEPVVLDNLSTGHAWAVKWGALVRGDILDRSAVESALRAFDIEAVVHFAACAYVGESMSNANKYLENNVAGTLNLLSAMLNTGVKTVVFSSSCSTYGIPQTVPIPVTHPQHPISPYGDSKLMGERMLYWFGQIHGFSWAALRYFNAAGADPEGELGEVHEPETHLIPLAIEAAHGRRPALKIFGTDYPTRDGTAVRDYIHVQDLAEAHVLALRYLRDGGSSIALNLGTGKGHSVQEVVAMVGRIANLPVPFHEAPRRKGDPAELVADPEAAYAELGWHARYDLEGIIQTALQWQNSALLSESNQAGG